MTVTPRRIAVVVGSESDIKNQTRAGLLHLKAARDEGRIELASLDVSSIHWNTLNTLELMREFSLDQKIDVLITGAGLANHLSGTCGAFSINELRNDHMVTLGVSFDSDDPEATMAAELSVSKVPRTQVVFKDEEGQFTGADGFLRACRYACDRELPTIRLPQGDEIRLSKRFTLEEALAIAK